MRVQVRPYDQFGRDVSWITQEVIEGYIFALIKGERFAKSYVFKHTQGDPLRLRTFEEVLLDDPDFDDLKDQIWDEQGLPEKGSIEYHIWQIERALESPDLPPQELSKLYKILGEYRGWITKPGEGSTQTVNINTVGIDGKPANLRTMNDKDAELIYMSLLTGKS
jgi:hypothetical protein